MGLHLPDFVFQVPVASADRHSGCEIDFLLLNQGFPMSPEKYADIYIPIWDPGNESSWKQGDFLSVRLLFYDPELRFDSSEMIYTNIHQRIKKNDDKLTTNTNIKWS